ncbi:MAG: hypothetical protein CMJ32_11630 [Phycisphaerae bacterium]|nr:hypothetical protein [Phycisphaerae bacterium]
MPLMKKTQSEPVQAGAVVLDLGDLREQAEAILQEARLQAEGIIGDARAKADAIISEAHPTGHEQGRRDGYEAGFNQGREDALKSVADQARQELQSLQDSWKAQLELFAADRERMSERAETDLIELALKIAAAVTRARVRQDPSLVIEQARGAIRLVMRASEIRAVVNPSDLPVLDQHMESLIDVLDSTDGIELVTSDQVEPGGCIVRGDDTVIDATLQQQIDRIAEALLGRSCEPGGDGIGEEVA